MVLHRPVELARLIGKFDGSGVSGSTGRGRSQALESKVRFADQPPRALFEGFQFCMCLTLIALPIGQALRLSARKSLPNNNCACPPWLFRVKFSEIGSCSGKD